MAGKFMVTAWELYAHHVAGYARGVRNNYVRLPNDRMHVFNAAYIFQLPDPIHSDKLLKGVVKARHARALRLNCCPALHAEARAHSYSFALRSRSALPMTDTELNVMAALAIIGLSTIPKNGYRRPAATGTPSAL